jgi:hypothetical protein
MPVIRRLDVFGGGGRFDTGRASAHSSISRTSQATRRPDN